MSDANPTENLKKASILEDPKGWFDSIKGGPYMTVMGGMGGQTMIMSGKGGLRACSIARLQNYSMAFVLIAGLALVLGPWMVFQTRELLILDYELDDPDMMPVLSPSYWINEWRKCRIGWRKGESGVANYFKPNFDLVERILGRDLANPSTWFKKTASQVLPRAFVPLCGDSPIVGDLAKMGYEVDAVDCSDVAIRFMVEKTESVLDKKLFKNIHLHFDDFFSPAFWRRVPERQFDVVYDRQALTAVAPKDREDYAFLIRRALKPDGVVVIETVYRSPHVPGHKFRGPPFDIDEEEIKRLFPAHDGFAVKCKEVNDRYFKGFATAEARVLGRTYPEFWTTSYPCVAHRTTQGSRTKRETTLRDSIEK